MQEKKFLITLKVNYFQQKIYNKIPTLEVATEPTKATKTKAKTKRKISTLKLCEECLNEIKNEEKNINVHIFREYFNYQSPLFLVKDLFDNNQNKTGMIVKYLNEPLIDLREPLTDLRNSINSRAIPENENPEKVVNI